MSLKGVASQLTLIVENTFEFPGALAIANDGSSTYLVHIKLHDFPLQHFRQTLYLTLGLCTNWATIKVAKVSKPEQNPQKPSQRTVTIAFLANLPVVTLPECLRFVPVTTLHFLHGVLVPFQRLGVLLFCCNACHVHLLNSFN